MSRIYEITKEYFPKQLLEIPDPPEKLYMRGNLPPPDAVMLCVVGARRYTSYGKEACEKFIAGLKEKNIAIVSGLALGIDTIAHRAAISAGLHIIAVPGSGIHDSVLYPHTNRGFAKEILDYGGCLMSEFEPYFVSTAWAFPKRNRIMAGLSKAVLVIEAERKSGTLITAKLATDFNRDLLTIPGSITSPNSEGPHLLLRMGATPITSSHDLLEALGFNREDAIKPEDRYNDCSDLEKELLVMLQDPMSRDELVRKSNRATQEINILLSLLELKGYVKEELGQLHLF